MRGPLHCPRIDKDLTGTLFVPEGVQKSVVVRGMNFPQVIITRGGATFFRYPWSPLHYPSINKVGTLRDPICHGWDTEEWLSEALVFLK